jgi:hypothetical protein
VNESHTRKAKPSRRFWRLVKNGDSWNEYSGAVSLIGAIVGLAVEHGVSLPWLERILTNPANAAAAQVKSAGNRSGRVSLATVRTWYERSSAQQQTTFCLESRRQQLRELQQLATSSAWPTWLVVKAEPGKKPIRVFGRDARRAFAAHVELSLESRGIDYPASRRKVAEHANLGELTAQRATWALVRAGVLQHRKPPGEAGPFTAANYRIDASGAALCRVLGDGAGELVELAELASLERHPIWRYGSGVRFDVWACIVGDDGSATARSIADATGATPATVRRVIRNLEQLGLVERCDDATVRALSSNHRSALDAAALATGAAERAQRQLERHESERAEHVRRVLRSPRMFAAAMRRRVQAVVMALRGLAASEPQQVNGMSRDAPEHASSEQSASMSAHPNAPPGADAA